MWFWYVIWALFKETKWQCCLFMHITRIYCICTQPACLYSLWKLGKHSKLYGVACTCTGHKMTFVCMCQKTHVFILQRLNQYMWFVFTAFPLNWMEMWIPPPSLVGRSIVRKQFREFPLDMVTEYGVRFEKLSILYFAF